MAPAPVISVGEERKGEATVVVVVNGSELDARAISAVDIDSCSISGLHHAGRCSMMSLMMFWE